MNFDPNSLTILAKARTTNLARDNRDRADGFAVPSDGPIDMGLRTAMVALYAGLSISDWNCVAEGYAMLEDIHTRIRKLMEG